MRLQFAALLVSLTAFFGCASLPSAAHTHDEDAEDANTVTNVSLLVGQRMLDEDDWEPVEEQIVMGVEVDEYELDESFGWEVGIQYSNDEGSVLGTDVSGSTTEFSFGVRKTFWYSGKLHPYIGLGVSTLRAENEISGGGSDKDGAVGAYAHAGMYWNVGQSFNVGVDVRTLQLTDITLNGVDADSNYFQGAVTLGLAF